MALASNPYESLPEESKRWLIDVYARARVAIKAALDQHGRAPGLGRAIARARIAFLDDELRPIAERVSRAGTPVDCRRGCSSCCTLKVEITPDEVFALVAELNATLDPASLAEARRRAEDVDWRGRFLPPMDRYLLRLSCPVLDEVSGACRAHAARPAPCQGYLALDHLRCEASSRGEPAIILKPVGADLVRDAVMSAQIVELQEAGYDQSRIELSAGLAAAWADPGAEQRWLAGGQAFTSALRAAPSAAAAV